MKGVIQLVTHSLSASHDRDHLTQGLLLLLASMMKRASSSLSATDFAGLKEYIFSHSKYIKDLLTSASLTDVAHEGRLSSP